MPRNASIARILAATPPRLGPFRIVSELGEGGFAPVFLATEEYGGIELRTVALKLFAIDDLVGARATTGTSQKASQERILEEARALCRVEHPNVVRFFQLVEDPTGAVLGLAMEHVQGRSLGTRLDAERVLPLDTTLAVGAAIASALAAVHAAGLLHRDVKPGNVIDAGGVYKLIDFGIATPARKDLRSSSRIALAPASVPTRASDRFLVTPSVAPGSARGGSASEGVIVSVRPEGLTPDLVDLASRDTAASNHTLRASAESSPGTDELAGTMGYVDPACFGRGLLPDASSDLYALGATLFECLTGRLPASQDGTADSLTRVRMDVLMGQTPPPPVRSLAPEVPEAVARLVDALVAPDRKVRPQRAEWVACELERLRRLQRGRASELPAEGPFRGLLAFDARHRDVYFGRATDIASALDLLRSRGLLALVGASGSGKSSLARAGVMPAIVDGALGAWPPDWRTVSLSPDAYPRAALAHALKPLLEGTALPDDPDELASLLAANVQRTSCGVVILVDALEELVTLAAPEDRSYLALFLAAVASRPMPGLRAIVTARRDLLDPLLGEVGLGVALARAVQLVAPLTASAWTDVVDERLAAYGFALEDEAMRAELARELASISEAMPLVEFGLSRLWQDREVDRHVLSRDALTSIGGLTGALARHAESTIDELAAQYGPTAAEVARTLLLALTTPHGTRATVSRSELAQLVPDPLREVVQAALEKARLVVSEEGRSTLAHEALIARWPRLHSWVQAERRDRELARDLEAAASRWRARPDADLLLRGRPLRDARALQSARAAMVSEEARVFVAASRKNELRSSGGVIGLVGSVFAFAVILGVAYWDSAAKARAEEAKAAKERSEVAQITKTLVQAANRPKTQAEREIEDMVIAKHACEKQLSRCLGDDDAGRR